jgi:hypothetical protein
MIKSRTPQQPIPLPSPVPQHQMSLALESPLLQGMAATEHANVLTALASLLLQAAGINAITGADDDER